MNIGSRMRMIRMIYKKPLRNGNLKGLLRDRTKVEDIENHLGESRLS